YAEPAGRRMRVELAGAVVAHSERVTLLHETGRYPVAYFPPADLDAALLRPSSKRTQHSQLGRTVWPSVEIGGQRSSDGRWSHPRPPSHAQLMAGLVAFVWDAMDAFYEEDEPILGHAADPYHRVDVRSSRRQLTVRLGGELVAGTRAPLAVFETGFAARWYVPRRDVAAGVLHDDPLRTLCPYKGVGRYFDVVAGGQRAAGGGRRLVVPQGTAGISTAGRLRLLRSRATRNDPSRGAAAARRPPAGGRQRDRPQPGHNLTRLSR